MAVAVPIPVSILCHSATLQNSAANTYQARTYTTVAMLSRVRVEPSTQQMLASDGTQTQLSALLFFDGKNSKPKGTAFEVGQYVLFDGNEYRIERVDAQYEKRKLHHYEVGLSG